MIDTKDKNNKGGALTIGNAWLKSSEGWEGMKSAVI